MTCRIDISTVLILSEFLQPCSILVGLPLQSNVWRKVKGCDLCQHSPIQYSNIGQVDIVHWYTLNESWAIRSDATQIASTPMSDERRKIVIIRHMLHLVFGEWGNKAELSSNALSVQPQQSQAESWVYLAPSSHCCSASSSIAVLVQAYVDLDFLNYLCSKASVSKYYSLTTNISR